MSTNDNEDEAVGYGRPPKKSRFKPRQSGNPRGRTKGSTNFLTDLSRTLKAPVVIQDRGKARKVTTQIALFMRLREKALKGDARALELLIQLARIQSVDLNADFAWADSATDQAILQDYRQSFSQQQAPTLPGDIKSCEWQGRSE